MLKVCLGSLRFLVIQKEVKMLKIHTSDARVLEANKSNGTKDSTISEDSFYIINTIEGSLSADVSSVRSMYEHLAKSAPAILDDSILTHIVYLTWVHMRLHDAETQKGASFGTLFGPAPFRKLNSGEDAKYLAYALSSSQSNWVTVKISFGTLHAMLQISDRHFILPLPFMHKICVVLMTVSSLEVISDYDSQGLK
nr:hypothetical protein [Tanacetum cinerariifolium]